MPSESLFPTLETDRLILREISGSDAAALFAIHGDIEAMRWFGSDPVPDIEGARGLIEIFAGWRILPNPGTRWGLQLKTNPTLIGTCGLFKWNRSWRSCAIGYELGAAHQGKGFMAEAVNAMIDWGFEAMELNRIEATIHPMNRPSITMAQRLGFVEEGRLREGGYWGGRFEDFLLFSLLRSDPRE
jgi:[ribosomal protein S5]-alanine N-acetyltransferase